MSFSEPECHMLALRLIFQVAAGSCEWLGVSFMNWNNSGIKSSTVPNQILQYRYGTEGWGWQNLAFFKQMPLAWVYFHLRLVPSLSVRWPMDRYLCWKYSTAVGIREPFANQICILANYKHCVADTCNANLSILCKTVLEKRKANKIINKFLKMSFQTEKCLTYLLSFKC